MIDPEKVAKGAFMTSRDSWLLPHIQSFIHDLEPETVLDPFAGQGALLAHIKSSGVEARYLGLDLDSDTFPYNDSLENIPFSPDLIVTNPPYLALHSAKRKGVFKDVRKYFCSSSFRDLYLIALERCLDASRNVIAIVPETFLGVGLLRERLHSVSILETTAPFEDTSAPVLVAVYTDSPTIQTTVYSDYTKLGTLHELDELRVAQRTIERAVPLRFNDRLGTLALKGVDGVSDTDRIRFMPSDRLAYDRARIKASSRLATLISSPYFPAGDALEELCQRLNEELEASRRGLGNLALSPFKGNTRTGIRRRRLDYARARGLISQVLNESRDLTASTEQLKLV